MKSTIGYILLATTMIGVVLAALLSQQSNLFSSVNSNQTSFNNQASTINLNLNGESFLQMQEDCQVVFTYNNGSLSTDSSNCLFPQAAFTELDSQLESALADPINSYINVEGNNCSNLASGYHSILITNLSLDSFNNDAQSGPQLNGYAQLTLDYLNDGNEWFLINFGSSAFTTLATDGTFSVNSSIGNLSGGDFYSTNNYFRLNLTAADLANLNPNSICISWPNNYSYVNLAQTSTSESVDYVHFYRTDQWQASESFDEDNQNYIYEYGYFSGEMPDITSTNSYILGNAFKDGVYSINTLEPFAENTTYCQDTFTNTHTFQYNFLLENVEPGSITSQIDNPYSVTLYDVEEIPSPMHDNTKQQLTFSNLDSFEYDLLDANNLSITGAARNIIPGYIVCFIPQNDDNTVSYEGAIIQTSLNGKNIADSLLTSFQTFDDVPEVYNTYEETCVSGLVMDSSNAGYYDQTDNVLNDEYITYTTCKTNESTLSVTMDEYKNDSNDRFSDNAANLAGLQQIYALVSEYSNTITDEGFTNNLDVIQNKLTEFETAFNIQQTEIANIEALDTNLADDEIWPNISAADNEDCEVNFNYNDGTDALELVDFANAQAINNPLCRFSSTAFAEIYATEGEASNTIVVDTCYNQVEGAHKIQFTGLSTENYNISGNFTIGDVSLSVTAYYFLNDPGDDFLVSVTFPSSNNGRDLTNVTIVSTLNVQIYGITPNTLNIFSNGPITDLCIYWANYNSFTQ